MEWRGSAPKPHGAQPTGKAPADKEIRGVWRRYGEAITEPLTTTAFGGAEVAERRGGCGAPSVAGYTAEETSGATAATTSPRYKLSRRATLAGKAKHSAGREHRHRQRCPRTDTHTTARARGGSGAGEPPCGAFQRSVSSDGVSARVRSGHTIRRHTERLTGFFRGVCRLSRCPRGHAAGTSAGGTRSV